MPALPIVLIGMPLSGKTTVGALLARELGWPFVDLDEAIETRTGRRIPDWLAESEAVFRQTEQRLLEEELGRSGQRVIAVGGGALESQQSRKLCVERAFLVYLELTVSRLMERIHGSTGRPLLDRAADPEAYLDRLLTQRAGHYRQAHYHLSVEDRSPLELVRMIADAYSEHHRR